MWLKTALVVLLVTNAVYGTKFDSGKILAEAPNLLTSGFANEIDLILPGLRSLNLFKEVFTNFFSGNNKTIGDIIRGQVERSVSKSILRNASEPCFNAITYSITSYSPIALNMLDASGKSASGTRRGTPTRKGNYHQCVDVTMANEVLASRPGLERGFVGKFCQVEAEYGQPSELQDLDYKEEQIYPEAQNQKMLKVELCVPSVCSTEDVERMFKIVSEMHHTDLRIRNLKCHQLKGQTLSAWSIFVICVCSMLACLLISATIYNIWLDFRLKRATPPSSRQPGDDKRGNIPKFHNPERLGQYLLCFSVQRNMTFILNHRQDTEEETIPSVNGIRFFTLCWVVLTNVFLIAKDRPWVNYVGFLEDLRTLPMQIIINGRFAADSSFCVGGLLAAYLTLKGMDRHRGRHSTLQHYLRRYLRLTPAYVLLMMLATGIYPVSIDGPDWMSDRELETGCKQHWWKGLLYVNNFSNGSESCSPISWYLATDMQLHLMAPFLIYPLHRFRSLGLVLLAIALATFTAISAIITATEKLPYFIGRLFYFEPRHEAYILHVLMKPWSHAGPFLVGMLFGYLLYRNGKSSSMRPPVATLGLLAAIATKAVIIFGFYNYIDGTRPMSVTTGILYAALVPSLWAVSTGWIVYACATGNGGVVNYFLSWGAYDVLARLSYCAYLVNGLAVYHFLHSRADSFYYDKCMMMVIFTGVMFTTMVSAIILSVAIERPFRELGKLWFGDDFQTGGARVVRDSDDDYRTAEARRTASIKRNNMLQQMGSWLKFRYVSEDKIALLADTDRTV